MAKKHPDPNPEKNPFTGRYKWDWSKDVHAVSFSKEDGEYYIYRACGFWSKYSSDGRLPEGVKVTCKECKDFAYGRGWIV